MELMSKLRILADAAKYDASCASSGSRRTAVEGGIGNGAQAGICHSYTPDGRCVSLLKILLTNYCVYDCTYCVNRISSDTLRARFTPAEVVYLTMQFYKRNYIEGLFLSSGVIQSPDYTMEQMIAVARSLRTEHRFGGYIHLKAVPGASPELFAEAGRWADRLSANIELPLQSDLDELAPAKSHAEVETAMTGIQNGIVEAKDAGSTFAPAGQSTQMIVGATETADRQILAKASDLYAAYKLRRVYYSAFSPIPFSDPGLPLVKPPLVREHRLYQADWLLRYYGFGVEEIQTEPDGNLPLDRDPKTAWALRNRQFFPVDVNTADREALLRVPGLGVRNVKRILQARRFRAVTIEDLRKLRVPVKKTALWVVTADSHPQPAALDRVDPVPAARQLGLFDTFVPALTGEL